MNDINAAWEMRGGESAKAYVAFCVYRDLGPSRSLAKVHDEITASGSPANLRWIEKWSSKYSWVQRATSWDAHEEKERLRQRSITREKARQKFADEAVKLATKLVKTALNGGADSAQVRALVEALDRAGVTAPKEINLALTDARASRLREKAVALSDATDAELEELMEAYASGELEVDEDDLSAFEG